jgi:Ca2+-binding RTX toxin-like protein
MFKRILTTTGVTLGAVALVATSAYADTIDGTPGSDNLTGTGQADTINGFAGNDFVAARGGNDLIRGGNGSDLLLGEGGGDRVYGGPGNDELQDWQQEFGGPEDTDFLYGGPGNDHLGVGNGKDQAFGGKGNDTFTTRADGNADLINCGPGWDVVTYKGARDRRDTLVNCERIRIER